MSGQQEGKPLDNHDFMSQWNDEVHGLVRENSKLLEHIDSLERELAQAKKDRDLALAHDTQPYPTAYAYEQACRALKRRRKRT